MKNIHPIYNIKVIGVTFNLQEIFKTIEFLFEGKISDKRWRIVFFRTWGVEGNL